VVVDPRGRFATSPAGGGMGGGESLSQRGGRPAGGGKRLLSRIQAAPRVAWHLDCLRRDGAGRAGRRRLGRVMKGAARGRRPLSSRGGRPDLLAAADAARRAQSVQRWEVGPFAARRPAVPRTASLGQPAAMAGIGCERRHEPQPAVGLSRLGLSGTNLAPTSVGRAGQRP